MATAKKVNKAEQVRAYQAKNPDASAMKVAKACNTNPAYVYAIRASDKGKAAKTPKQGWKMVHMSTSKESIERPKFSIDSLPKVGDVVGGMTLTRKEAIDGDGFVYRWVRTEPVKPTMVDMTQHADGTITEKVTMEEPQADNVNHPAHYKVGGIETIDFIEAKNLSYHLGNVVKYIARADSKGNREEDLLKARWYLNREIAKFSK